MEHAVGRKSKLAGKKLKGAMPKDKVKRPTSKMAQGSRKY